MGVIISYFNAKGGVAKTTSCVNIGAIIASAEKKVLIVDIDSQASATACVGINEEELKLTIFDLLKNKKATLKDIKNVIIHTKFDNLDIIPSNIGLSTADLELSGFMDREMILKNILEKLKDDYDYIFIDCPPNLALMSINSLSASDYIIIPVSPNFLSVKGIKHLVSAYNLIKKGVNPKLEIMGILITMYDSRKNIAKDIRNQLSKVFNDQIFDTVIRMNSQIEYSQNNQTPLIYYNQKCTAFEDYCKISQDIINFIEGEY